MRKQVGKWDGLTHTLPLDGDLSDERFHLLAQLDAEFDALDKKETVLLTKAGLASLAKDVAAMANSGGGYLLLGVSRDSATPAGLSSEIASELGEPTRLADKMGRYLDPLPRLHCRRVRTGVGSDSVIVYVHPFDSVPVLFFREAEGIERHALYVRRKVASLPASKDDWQRILSQVVERQRANWTKQVETFVALARDLASAVGSDSPSTGEGHPVAPEGPTLPAGIEDTQANRTRVYLASITKDPLAEIERLRDGSADPDVQTNVLATLDRLVSLASDQIRLPSPSLLDLTLESFRALVANGVDDIDSRKPLALFLAEAALCRLYAMGVAGIAEGQLWAVRKVTVQDLHPGDREHGFFWHRYLMILLYRNDRVKGHPLKMATDFLSQDESGHGREEVQDLLCQFDCARCLLSEQLIPGGSPLPLFAIYHRRRIEPLLRLLVTDPKARLDLLGDTDDKGLRDLARRVSEEASDFQQHSGLRYQFFFLSEDWSDPGLRAFFGE